MNTIEKNRTQLKDARDAFPRASHSALIGGLLIVLGCAHAQSRPSLADLVSVTPTTPSAEDAGAANISRDAFIEVAVRNGSAKDIVAYSVSITTYTRDGQQTAGNMTWDLVPSFGALSLTGGDAPITNKYQHIGPLKPGEVGCELIRRPTDADGHPGAAVTTSIKAVIFGDNTIAGDREAVDWMFDDHLGAADQLDIVSAELRAASPGPLHERVALWLDEFTPRGRRSTSGASSQISERRLFGRDKARNLVTYKLKGEFSSGDESVLRERLDKLISYLAAEAEAFRRYSIERTSDK